MNSYMGEFFTNRNAWRQRKNGWKRKMKTVLRNEMGVLFWFIYFLLNSESIHGNIAFQNKHYSTPFTALKLETGVGTFRCWFAIAHKSLAAFRQHHVQSQRRTGSCSVLFKTRWLQSRFWLHRSGNRAGDNLFYKKFYVSITVYIRYYFALVSGG